MVYSLIATTLCVSDLTLKFAAFLFRMPAVQIALLLMVVLVTPSFARHLEKTENDGADELSTKVEREELSESAMDSANDDHILEIRELKDIKGGRSPKTLRLSQSLGAHIARQTGRESVDNSHKLVKELDESVEDGFGPPGLWGRREIRHEENEKSKQEDGEKLARLPGLWGRETRQSPPGLWGRGISNDPPGLWGRGVKNGPPGLWGRNIISEVTENGKRRLPRMQKGEDA